MKKTTTYRGGGIHKQSNISQSTNTKGFFRPLIASSLAIALGVSVASAAALSGTQTISTPTNSDGILANAQNAVITQDTESSITLTGTLNQDGGADGTYTILSKGYSTTIDFNTATTINIGSIYTRYGGNSQTILNVTQADAVLTLGGIRTDSGTKGLQVNFKAANADLKGITTLASGTSAGGTNTFTFEEIGKISGKIDNSGVAGHGGAPTNTIIFKKGGSIEGEILASGTANNIIGQTGSTQILNNIVATSKGRSSAKNTVALSGSEGAIGAQNQGVTLSIQKEGSVAASNLISLNATTTNQVYLTDVIMNGYYDSKDNNLNILSFNKTSGNTLVIGNMSAKNGSNIIGKDYLTADGTLSAQNPDLSATYAATFGSDAGTNKLTLTSITANSKGQNILNLTGKLIVSDTIKVYGTDTKANSGGKNIIHADSLQANKIEALGDDTNARGGDNIINIDHDATITLINSEGTGTAAAGTNFVTVGGTLNLDQLTASKGGTNAIKAENFTVPGEGVFKTTGATNKIAIGLGDTGDKTFARSLYAIADGGYSSQNALVLNGANATLGASGEGNAIDLTIAKDNGNASTTASNLVILNGATTNKAYIDSMQVVGNAGGDSKNINANILSLNGASGTIAINSMSSATGMNIIGKDYLETDSDGQAIRKVTKTGAGAVDVDASIFDTNGALIIKNSMNAANSADLALTLTSMNAGTYGKNLVNITGKLTIDTITVQGNSALPAGANLANTGNYIVAGELEAGTINAMYNNNTNVQGGRNALKITNNAVIAKLNAEGSGTSAGGKNYLEVGGQLTLGSISASNGGTNIIKAKTFVDNSEGDFATTGGTNQITIGNGTAGVNFAKTLKVQTTGGYGANNALYLHGTTVSFGTDDSHRASLIMNPDGSGNSNQSAQNLVMLNGTTSNTTYIDQMSARGNYGSTSDVEDYNFNILSLETNNGNININSMFARNATNMIGKGLLDIDTTTNGVILDKTLFSGGVYSAGINAIMSDTNAMNGVLSITEGLSTEVDGRNIVSYVASASADKTIIRGNTENKNAISGRADIYLNVKDSGFTSGIDSIADFISSNHDTTTQQALINNAVVAGNIVATNDGNTNLKIIGKSGADATQAATNVKMGLLGNITNNSNKAINIVLEDAFYAPSELLVNGNLLVAGGKQSGMINTSSGVTNIVTRFTDVSPTQTGAAYYTINASGNAQTNIALQGDYQIGGNVNYTGNSAINILFASSSTGSDNFELAKSADISNNTILGTAYENGLKLSLHDKTIYIGDKGKSFTTTYADIFRGANGGNMGRFLLSRTATVDTLTIDGLILGTLSPLANSTQKSYVVEMNANSAFVGSVAVEAGSKVSLKMDQGSKLVIDNPVFYVDSLNSTATSFDQNQVSNDTFLQSNTIVDLATDANSLGNIASRENFNLFVIGDGTTNADSGLQGKNLLFRVYANADADQSKASLGKIKANTEQNDSSVAAGGNKNSGYMYSDRIFITDTGTANADVTLTQNIQVIFKATTANLDGIHYTKGGTSVQGNIAVATVGQTATDKNPLVKFVAQDVLQGFDQVSTTLIEKKTDKYGKEDDAGTYTTWFVDSAKSKGATEERAEVSATALATNYDLYLANFNSLNKRMGELRDNANSQGAWARVFTGAQTNDFGLGSKTTYTTIQAGYDYAFGFEGANNYVGLAVAYGMSSSESQKDLLQALDNKVIGIDSVKSSTVEVALYNSYVQDEGWYNDSIFKFSYIMSDINLLRQTSTYNTNNMAFTLSDEFGYRFKLGAEKEWYIDPQLELAFGYFDQSDLKQVYGDATLNTTADSVMNLRARFGSSFGYDFKQFTEGKGVDAKLYVGAFYEYDYITGGDVTMTTNLNTTTTTASTLASDGRVVVNVGTNVTVKENTRIYFDFETSFAGKIRTDYQANVGVRYSFGENAGYIPANVVKKEVAPLKVSDEKAQESKESTESTSHETKSEATTEQNTNSTENKAEEKAQ